MRGELTYDNWYRRVKENSHEGMADGSGGWDGADAKGCKTLVERVISRKATTGTISKRKGKGILS